MSRGKKSDTATTADWSFLDWPGVAVGLEKLARKTATDWGMDSDGANDLLAEAHLGLAVRGEKLAADHAKGGVRYVMATAHGIMRDRARTDKKRRDQTEALEPGYDDEEY